MPYKDPEVKREYQRRWVAQRRADYLSDKTCVHCGTRDDLILVSGGVYRDKITGTHQVFSYGLKERERRLKASVVLCKFHRSKYRIYQTPQG
jgi:5-methylcytosine-specific restriction endonuclease McrA